MPLLVQRSRTLLLLRGCTRVVVLSHTRGSCAAALQVDDWHFNAFELAEVTNNRPLSTLAFALFSRSKLMPRYEISEVKLAR